MINCQKFNFLLSLTINSVTTAVRELNGTSQISLVTHDAKGEMRDLDEVSSGLARMVITGKTTTIFGYNVGAMRSLANAYGARLLAKPHPRNLLYPTIKQW